MVSDFNQLDTQLMKFNQPAGTAVSDPLAAYKTDVVDYFKTNQWLVDFSDQDSKSVVFSTDELLQQINAFTSSPTRTCDEMNDVIVFDNTKCPDGYGLLLASDPVEIKDDIANKPIKKCINIDMNPVSFWNVRYN